MRALSFLSGAGMLVACTATQAPLPAPVPQPDAVSPLERAVLADPGDAQAWQRLGEMLMVLGDDERAQRMLQQAHTLRSHSVRDDYAVLRGALAEAAPGMPRTELREIGPALFELRRTPVPHPPVVRLEISNGNGVPGLAAAWGRSLRSQQLQVIRLSNAKPFNVPATRVQYRGSGEQAQILARRIGVLAVVAELDGTRPGAPDMRLILGRDIRKKPPTGVGGKLFD